MANFVPLSSKFIEKLHELRYSSFSIIQKEYMNNLDVLLRHHAHLRIQAEKGFIEKLQLVDMYNNLLRLFRLKRLSSKDKWKKIIEQQRAEEEEAQEIAQTQESGRKHIKSLEEQDDKYNELLQEQVIYIESGVYPAYVEYKAARYDTFIAGVSLLLQASLVDAEYAEQLRASADQFMSNPTTENQKHLSAGEQILLAGFIVNPNNLTQEPEDALKEACDSQLADEHLAKACDALEKHCSETDEKKHDPNTDVTFRNILRAEARKNLAGHFFIAKDFQKQKLDKDPEYKKPNDAEILQNVVDGVLLATSFLSQMMEAANAKYKLDRETEKAQAKLDENIDQNIDQDRVGPKPPGM